MRLSVNVAQDPIRPSCGHASPWCVVVVLGAFIRGQMRLARAGYNVEPCPGRPGDLLILENNISIGPARFTGDRYQLEFFLAPGTYPAVRAGR
jgi:hypothetical protein